jgi:hypothetical protein
MFSSVTKIFLQLAFLARRHAGRGAPRCCWDDLHWLRNAPRMELQRPQSAPLMRQKHCSYFLDNFLALSHPNLAIPRQTAFYDAVYKQATFRYLHRVSRAVRRGAFKTVGVSFVIWLWQVWRPTVSSFDNAGRRIHSPRRATRSGSRGRMYRCRHFLHFSTDMLPLVLSGLAASTQSIPASPLRTFHALPNCTGVEQTPSQRNPGHIHM